VLLSRERLQPKDGINLIQQIEESGEEDVVEGVPVYGANLASPVTDTALLDRFTTK
jgi:hypothetical protein